MPPFIPTNFDPIFDPYILRCCEGEHWRIHAKESDGEDFYLVKCDPKTGDYDPSRDMGDVFSPQELDDDFLIVNRVSVRYYRDEDGEIFPEGFLPDDGRELELMGRNHDRDYDDD